MMAVETTRETARRFIRVRSAGQLHRLDQLASEDIVLQYTHFAQPIRRRKPSRALLQRANQQYQHGWYAHIDPRKPMQHS